MTITSYPIHELFLYFMLYSFLGWLMETCYCSMMEHKPVARGFLYGPICPIYGCGVLIMVLFFTPLKGNLILFYVTAVVVMTSWEYFVGWLLETTTHMKYWDYSNYKFNLNGRVCLWVALVWGVLSYIIIFLVHPPIEALYERLPLWLVYTLCGILGSLLLADAVLTIRQLALVSRLVVSANTAREELQLQMSLGKAELSDKLDDRTEAVREKYRVQMARLEQYSRRFRKHYAHMSVNSRYAVTMDDLRAAGALAKEELQRRKAERKAR
jgi:uncharacterized membrane protein